LTIFRFHLVYEIVEAIVAGRVGRLERLADSDERTPACVDAHGGDR
jgi:hypothetical protein